MNEIAGLTDTVPEPAVPDLPDLSACEREPIHAPGAIQPHGCLLSCSMPDWTVNLVSANAAEFVGRDPRSMLGMPLDSVLPSTTVHDLRNVLQASLVSEQAERLPGACVEGTGVRHDLTVHVSGANALVEIALSGTSAALKLDPVTLVRSMVARLRKAPSFDRLLNTAARQVRSITGFDRVMIYKFLENGSGQVVAEALRAGLPPFLDLRYPASDIPPQARRLYKRQWLRAIPDVNYRPVPLLARSGLPTDADLSLVGLRSVSPVHLEYLRTMGSFATLTVSLMMGDELWGLIACHHHEGPRLVSASTCAAAELFGQFLSARIEASEQVKEQSTVERSRAAHDRMIADMPPETTVFDDPALYADALREIIACDGIGVWSDRGFAGVGTTPPEAAIPDLIQHLDAHAAGTCLATDSLGATVPSAAAFAAEVSGLLAVAFSTTPRSYLMFFRQEVVQTVSWGGNPNKPVEVTDGGYRIGPRKSFEAWRETVLGHAVPWRPAEIRIAETLRVSLLDLILRRAGLVDREQRATQARQEILVAELNHRVKNILALIRSLVRQTRLGAKTLDGFAGDLEHRITALALAHDQLTLTGWGHAPLRRLIEAEAKAWAQPYDRLAVTGPHVTLDPRAYQALALVIHEMMTNAAKYGCLSQSSGRLAIAWDLDQSGNLAIDWIESGGPPVEPPSRNGFGSFIVERTIPFELQGAATVDFRPEGVRGRFTVPATYVAKGTAEPGAITKTRLAPEFTGKRLLLVEDRMMIALDAQAMLGDEGHQVEIAGTGADALALLRQGAFEGAVLDINLFGESSFEVADEVARLGLPFVFATGYGENPVLPERFRAVPVVSKPYDAAALRAALVAMRGRADDRPPPPDVETLDPKDAA